jgi:hypothetical protein
LLSLDAGCNLCHAGYVIKWLRFPLYTLALTLTPLALFLLLEFLAYLSLWLFFFALVILSGTANFFALRYRERQDRSQAFRALVLSR